MSGGVAEWRSGGATVARPSTLRETVSEKSFPPVGDATPRPVLYFIHHAFSQTLSIRELLFTMQITYASVF